VVGGRRELLAVLSLTAIAALISLATTDSAGAQAAACLPTGARIVSPHSFKGLIPRPPAPVYTDATQFVTAGGESLNDPINQIFLTGLQQNGFVSGISQLFNPPRHHRKRGFRGQAISTTVQLAGDQQAIAEAGSQRQLTLDSSLPQEHWVEFTVTGIPGSTGLLERAKRKFGGASNVFFSDGPYAYVVGEAPRRGAGYAAVTSAALRLYNTVHGAPVCP
jgi:hypothetical protein